jgi:hypothetical protein
MGVRIDGKTWMTSEGDVGCVVDVRGSIAIRLELSLTFGAFENLGLDEVRQRQEHQRIASDVIQIKGQGGVNPSLQLGSLGQRHDRIDIGIDLIAHMGMDNVDLAGELVKLFQVEGIAGLSTDPAFDDLTKTGLFVEAPGVFLGDDEWPGVFFR